jgi:hypothetical protein
MAPARSWFAQLEESASVEEDSAEHEESFVVLEAVAVTKTTGPKIVSANRKHDKLKRMDNMNAFILNNAIQNKLQ